MLPLAGMARALTVLLCLALSETLPCLAGENVYTVLDASDGLSDNQVQYIQQLPDGRMVITSYGNINIYDGARFTYIHKRDSIEYRLRSYAGAYHVYADDSQRLWVKDNRKLICMDLRKESFVTDLGAMFAEMGVRDTVTDLFVDSDKGLWLLTAGGLLRGSTMRRYELPAGAGVLKDVDVAGGGLFMFFSGGEVACYDMGTCRLLYRKSPYGADRRHLFDKTSQVRRGADGVFYLLRSGDRYGFFTFNPHTRKWRTVFETAARLHTLHITPDMEIYISCRDGLWHGNARDMRLTLQTSLPTAGGRSISTGLNTVFCDMQGGTWIGTYNKGVLYSHPSRYRFVTVGDGSRFFPQGRVPRAARRQVFEGRRYVSLLTDSRGWTWGGTPDGLRLFRPDSSGCEAFYTEDGLANNFIHSLVEDRRYDIWAGTSHGISRIHVRPEDGGIVITSYGTPDGTLPCEYADGAAWLLGDGRVCMRGLDGWTLFCPDSIRQPGIQLAPILTGVYLHGEKLRTGCAYGGRVIMPEAAPYTGSIMLDHDQNAVAFEFSAMNYVTPAHTYYRYSLNSKEWHVVRGNGDSGMTGERGVLRLSFAGLAPGTYSLRVMASVDPGLWSGPCKEIVFRVCPPWWLSVWALCLYVLAAAGCVAAGVWLRMRHLRRRHREELLLMRIKNLIVQCDRYRVMAQAVESHGEGDDGPEERREPADAEFLARAIALVERNLNVAGYSVEQLSRDLCMERTGLYKKLTVLMDKSPSLFIRSIRLRKAAELMAEGRMGIGEIADVVGFSSSSYMSKCFQEEYGCRPSEYVRRKGGGTGSLRPGGK